MATPEQNALLAIQLFGAPAEQFNRQNDARTNLAFKLAAMQREEQLKRDLMADQDQRAFKLAEMQAGREDKRNQTTLDWHKLQNESQDKRETARLTEAEKRAKAATEAKDKADLTNEFDRLYPQYTSAAARAGMPIKQRADFPETRAGLGQLSADLSTAAVGFEEKKLKGAAMSLVGGLDEAVTAVDAIKSRIGELAKPLPQELKVARSQAVKALQAAIEQKQLASTEKLRPAAIKKGLAHLAAGEDALARELLGAEAFTAFENATEQVLLGLDSRKSAMQERSQLNQQLLQLQSQAARTNSDVMKAAAGNTFLADELAKRRTSIQQLMTPIEEPKRRRTFEEVTPERGTGAGTNQPPPKPTAMQSIGFGGGFDPNAKVPPPTGGGFGFGGPSIASAPPTAEASNFWSSPIMDRYYEGIRTAAPVESPESVIPDRAPYSLGHDIRNMMGGSPINKSGFAFDLQKLNDQLQFQNERGRATTLQQLQQLLIRAQTDPALAPGN